MCLFYLYPKAESGILYTRKKKTTCQPGRYAAPEQLYERAGALLRRWMKEGSLQKEAEPCYYIYELERLGHVQTGIAACVSADDYRNGVIRRHENTRTEKEEDRTRHVRACGAQTGPVFLAYRAARKIREITERCRKERPELLTREDGRQVRCFRYTDQGKGDSPQI